MKSFDVFDTAIFRKVYNPHDLFDIIESKVGGDFKKLRIEAEQKAATASPTHYDIFDIYDLMPKFFNRGDEIKAELENCIPNIDILDIYNPDEDIFISDMYLPAYVIKTMLERCGYEDPMVFCSADEKCCKGDGRLFVAAQESTGRKISVHYGDNYMADIVGARKAGIPAVFTPALNSKPALTNVSNSKLKRYLESIPKHSVVSYTGYYFAPLVLEFTKWIIREADGKPIYFCSRDGLLPYIIATEILKYKGIAQYVQFSRGSTVYAAFDTSRYIDDQPTTRVFEYFNFIGEGNSERIYARATEDRKRLLSYINSIGMKSGDYFVDIGYSGTIQHFIELASGLKLKGLYLQTTIGETTRGLGLDMQQFLSRFVLGTNCVVLESIFTALKGRCIGYEEDGEPIYDKTILCRSGFTQDVHKAVLEGVKYLLREGIETPVADCEILTERFLSNPTPYEAHFGMEKIFEDSVKNEPESIVNFDEKGIEDGYLLELYERSYWKTAFIVNLKNHSRFSSLISILESPSNDEFVKNENVIRTVSKILTSERPFMFYGCGSLLRKIMETWPVLKQSSFFCGTIDVRARDIRAAYGMPCLDPKDVGDGLADIYISVIYQGRVKESLDSKGIHAIRMDQCAQ